MAEATVYLWDKKSGINGVGVARLKEKFTAENGSDDRVLIAYDGVVSRIQYVDESMFNEEERANVAELTSGGMEFMQAVADTWVLRLRREEREADEREMSMREELEELREAVGIVMERNPDAVRREGRVDYVNDAKLFRLHLNDALMYTPQWFACVRIDLFRVWRLRDYDGKPSKYDMLEKVRYGGIADDGSETMYECRKSHTASEDTVPGENEEYWVWFRQRDNEDGA